MNVALTGHRPERLGFSELSNPIDDNWRRIIDWCKEKLFELNTTDIYFGMANGSDIAFGIAASEINNSNINQNEIKIHGILPCKNYNHTDEYYDYLKNSSYEWLELSEYFYKGCDNARDQYMVDHCDVLLAIWDGNKSGGVWSTIRKAQKAGKQIIYIPKELLKVEE